MSANSQTRLLGYLSTAVLTCDRRSEITYLNTAAQMLLAIGPKRVTGQPLANFISGADLPPSIERVLADGQAVTLRELTIVGGGREGDVPVDCTLTRIPDRATGAQLLVELTRIDQFMRFAREGRQRERHAANQMLVRGLAHEIKNPLGGLRGAAQLLEREINDPALRPYTKIIIGEADRLRNLVDRMTEPYRPAARCHVNIHEVLEHVRRLVTAVLPNGVSLDRDYDPSLPAVHGNKEQLIQALLNVVRNAAQAVTEQGNIRLRTRIDHQHTMGGIRHRQVVRIDVEDNGPGVSGALGDQIFDPLVTGRAEGTGLGLPITQEIVSHHQGTVEYRTIPGYTQFTLYLPVAQSS
jgi:two-component system nitrogen regulation sensor histidine kinase GlnL